MESSGKDLYIFGKEISKIKYNDFSDFLVNFQNPIDIWKNHKSLILTESVFMFGAVIIMLHSIKTGGRWPFLYVAAILHGLVVENLCYFLPDINNFWHAQGIVTLIEHRLPLYVIFLYPVFYYQSAWTMSKLKLKCPYSEYLAFGLLTVLIDIPYDIIGVKYLHWIWHDTDPNIAERHYWVPWNSYYFHACFAVSFQFFFHKTRNAMDKRSNLEKWKCGSIVSEICSVIVAGILGMPGGCLLFIPLYHPLHDYFKIPTEVTTITLLVIFITIVWKFDRKSNRYTKPKRMNFLAKGLLCHLVLHYGICLFVLLFINPEDVVSIGLHEPVGNCNETVPVHTILWTLSKRKYLCVTDYDETYYDFHCLPSGKLPENGSIWYTICGTAIKNYAEYVTVLSLICFVAFFVFRTIHFDYDQRIEKRLTDQEKEDLEKPFKVRYQKVKVQ